MDSYAGCIYGGQFDNPWKGGINDSILDTAPTAAEAVETVVVTAGGFFIDQDPGTAIDSDRATVPD